MSSAKIRVVIADDHAVLREGIRALLSAAGDIEVVGEAADGKEAIDAFRKSRPDVVLMDVAMPGLGGLEASIEILGGDPAARILILSQYDDREYVSRFLKAGVAGYVLKKAAGSELVAAIRAVHRGGMALDPAITREALNGHAAPATAASAIHGEIDPYESLTDREKQVLKLVAEGSSNKEIADILGISVKTAMTHRERLMEKLGLHNRTEVVKFAIRRGVVPL